MLQDGDANILASPRIRVRNKEKAKFLVGDKLPVFTTLVTPGQNAGANNYLTSSIQYLEVGIKLEVEPQIYGDGDVGLKINLEVSNVANTVKSPDGSAAYQIGTRSTQTSLRLHDGETQVMAGLIDDHDRNTAQKVPGLGQLPMLGRLFSNTTGDNKKSEILLSITPRIIRPLAVSDPRFSDAWSGTDGNVRDRSLRIEPLAVLKAPTPTTGAAPAPAPALPGPGARLFPGGAPGGAVAPAAPAGAPATGGAVPAAPAAAVPTPSLVTPRPLPNRPLVTPAPAPAPALDPAPEVNPEPTAPGPDPAEPAKP
jgi:general secretion pathway protein D